jgi:hypothetical protein
MDEIAVEDWGFDAVIEAGVGTISGADEGTDTISPQTMLPLSERIHTLVEVAEGSAALEAVMPVRRRRLGMAWCDFIKFTQDEFAQ